MEMNSDKNPITPIDGAEVEVSTSKTPEAQTAEEHNNVEATQVEQTSNPESVADEKGTDESAVREGVDTSAFSAEELYEYLDKMVKEGNLPEEREMKRLKSLVNNVNFDPHDDTDLDDEEDDGEERDPEAPTTKEEMMEKFINLKTRYHELSAQLQEAEKEEKEQNYQKKLHLIERLEKSLNSTDDFFTVRNEFENIRTEWKNTGLVPESLRSDLIEKYSKLLDEFYTQNKLNPEEHEHDFTNNRKEKEHLISRAKELAEEEDVIKAFRELQTLNDQWKETGPVATEFREAMWKEFKDAASVINKRHDDFFKKRHEEELENLEKKKKIVEELENMLIKLPETRDGWRNYERKMDKIRNDWKASGRVPRASVNEVRTRYRVAVNEFYLQRRSFMRELSEFISPKLERMRELVAEAESFQESSEWNVTTKKLQDLQKEWTEVSKLGTRVAEAQRLWRRFRGACDVFFQRKSEVYKDRMADREANYEAKADVVRRMEELVEKRPATMGQDLVALQEEWKGIGRVPNEKKDELLDRYYGALRSAMGGQRGRRQEGGRRDDRRQSKKPRQQEPRVKKVDLKKDLTELSNPQLEEEQANIRRNISRLEEELLQYETNIGFFNASPDNPMILQIQGKIDQLRAQIEEYNKRIDAIKEEMKNPTPKEETPEVSEPEVDMPAEEEQSATEEVATEVPAEEAETRTDEIEEIEGEETTKE